VSECMGIDGNEIADIINQARLLKSTYRTWNCPWHIYKVARVMTGGSTSRKHKECWQSAQEWHQTEGLLKKPAAKRAGELFELGRNWLRIMIGLLTEHWHVNGCLFNLGLPDSPGVIDANRHLQQPHLLFVTKGQWWC
jgi:hypothetical protein